MHSSCIAIIGKMSARTHFRLWEYRKIDDALLQVALNFPIGDKKAANIDTITKTSDNQAMTDSDEEVIVNITCQLCKNCDKVFDNQQQLQMHDKECTPESTCPECEKRYSTVHNMLKHFKIKHGSHVKMEQCSSATSSQDDLQFNRLSRSKSTESLRTKRASSSHVGKGLKKSTGEILLPEGNKSSHTKTKISSQQDTELDKVKNMKNVDIEQRIKSNTKNARGKCKSSIDTRHTVCKTAQQEVTSHNGSSDNPKRQQENEIQSVKDKQRGSLDKMGNDKKLSRITSSTKMKIKPEIKKRNVDSKSKSVERYIEKSCKSVVLRSNSDMEKSCKQMEQGSLIDDTDKNTSLMDIPRSLNGNKHKGTTLTETQESMSYKTAHNKSETGHGSSKQRLGMEQMQPKRQKFSCGLCTKTFTSRMGYKQHCKKTHKTIPDLDVSVQTIPHPSSEESSEKWTCTLCPSHFKSWTKLTKHCLDSHNGVQCVNNSIQNMEMGELELKQEEECSVNDSKFNKSLNRLGFEENLVFEQGREEYLKKPYACSLCNRRYNYEKGLLSHCKDKHNGLGIEKDNNEPLACSVCNAKFKNRKAMKNHCIKFHEGSGLKKDDTLIEKTSMLRQKKSGKIKKVKTETSFNKRVTLLKGMTNRSQNKLKNVEKKSKVNLFGDENCRKVKLNQRKDFSSAQESEIVTTSCSNFTTEQDKKQLDEQKNKQVTEKGNGSGRIELKELKVLVKRCAPIPYSRDCQKNEQLTENINTGIQKLNKQNEVVDQTGPSSVDSETKNNPLTDTQCAFTMRVKDNLHERLLIPLNSLNVSAKRSNDDFRNFKITVAHSSQRIVSAITQDPMENQTTTEIEEHLNGTQKKQALSKEEIEVSRWSGIETHIMEPLGAQHSEVKPVKLLGKSCVSINSPKAQRLKHSKNDEKGDSLTCANSGKRSNITCESLAKRLERTNLHHEQRKISEVKGQGDRKSIGVDTNQKELNSKNKDKSSGNYYNSVEMQNNELKDKLETKRRSPKLLLDRFPPIEVEKSVNVNDVLLKGSLDKMAASPNSISNRNQNMFHNEMMLEKSWSSEDEEEVMARKVADLREIIRARRSKKYGGIKEMYQVNKDISVKNTSKNNDIKSTHENQSGSKDLSIGSEKISIDGKCSTESNETSVGDDNEDQIDISSNNSLYRSKEELKSGMTEYTNKQMTDISSGHQETIKNSTLLHNLTVDDTTEENRKLVEKKHELTITDNQIGRTVKGKRRAVRNMNSTDQSKHALKTLPSLGKQKKMPLVSKKKRKLFSFSHKDPSLDTNQNVMDEVAQDADSLQNVMDEVAQDADSLQNVHEVTDKETNTSNRDLNTRKDTTKNEVLNTETDFRQNELTTEEIEPVENNAKKVDSTQNESLNSEIDPIQSGNEMDPIQSGNEMDPRPSGYQMEPIQSGNQMDPIQSGNQMDPIPSGNEMDPIQSGNQVDPIQSGNEMDPVQSGNEMDPIPNGNQMDPIQSGNQMDPIPSGNQMDPIPSGNQMEPVPSGNQMDPVPSGYQMDPIPSGNQVDPMPSGNQVDPMGSGSQCLNTDLDKNELACPGKKGNSSFSCTTEMLSGFEKETHGDNGVEHIDDIDETVDSTEESNNIEKETFKVLKLNWNPYFSDKRLVPLDISEEEEQTNTEKINPFPKIIRYVNDSQAPEISNALSSASALDDILPQMFKMLTHENGLDLNGVFNDIVVENANDCYEIDYGVTDSTSDFLALGHCFRDRPNPDIVCDLCGKIFHCNEKYVEHKCKEDRKCTDFSEVDMMPNSSFSHIIDDSVLDKDKDDSQKFVCNICGLKYKSKKSLKRHCKNHHSAVKSSEKVFKLKIKIKKLNKSLFSEKKELLSSIETSGNISPLPDDQCTSDTVDDLEKVVRYVAEPISECDYSSSVDDVTCDGDSTLVNLSMQSPENVSSSLSTLASSRNHDISGNGHADIDITNCSTEADTTIVDSCLNESLDSQQNVHCNQSISHSTSDGESHKTNSVFELHIAKTPEKGLKTMQQHLVSTPIKQYMAKAPVQTLFEDAKENSPNRVLNSFNQESAITDQVFTLEEINRKFKNILLECKVELEYLQLEEEYLYIEDITLMKVGTCRWKVLSENQNLTLDSQANGIDDNDSDTEFVIHKIQSEVNNRSNSQNIRPATNDFDVNCPTYEIEYFPSSSQLEDNSSLDNAFQTINSSSDAQKLNKVKESRTNLLQSSPKKKLTEFEKAIITKPMEVRRKRKLERTVSTLDDSNSHDGLDFLKRANEPYADNPKNENYFMSSKLAQSIIHKKAKQNEQENLNFAPCGIEDIEPFEAVLASRDKVKKSPLKKKKKTKLKDSEKSTRTVLSNTLDSCLSNNSNQNTSADVGDVTLTISGEISEMFQDDVTVETPRKIVLSNDSVLRNTSETFDMPSSLGRYDNVPLKTVGKQKSLSERFGAIEKPSNSGDDSSNLIKSFKNLRSEEVMKSMFGTGAAKFDKKFRKQPGEESKQDTLMSLKSPLESVERIVTVKYGSRPIPDLKQTVVATERKQPANTKRHLLNMLKELMDSPDGKSISPNVSLSSPKDTGIFTDTQSVRTIIDTQKDKSYESINFTKNSINYPINKKQHLNITKFGVIGEPTIESERIESTPAKSVTGKSDFSVIVEQKNEKNTLLSTAKTCEKPDLPHDNSSDISCTDNLCERSNSSQHSIDISTSWRKRSGSETEGQPRKKKRIERMPVDDDKTTNGNNLLSNVETQSKTVTSLSNVEAQSQTDTSLSNVEAQSKTVTSLFNVEIQSKPVANTTQTVPSSYITKTTDMHLDGGKTTDKSMQSDRTGSNVEHESRVERKEESQNLTELAVDMEAQEEIVENFSTVDDTFEFDVDDHGQENENLISELEPETKVKQSNVFDESSRNINGREDSYDAENVNKHPEWNVNLSPFSSERSADFEQLENDNENIEDNSNKGNRDYGVDSDSSGNAKCDESDNENSDKSDNEEEKENIASGKDDDSDESTSEEDTASSKENSDEEGNDTDDESKDENHSDDENGRDEIKEDEDIFSSTKFLPTKDFYHDDDAISILVDEFETASFLIAPEGDEKERMKSLDEELGELNTENTMDCDMDICSISPDTASNTQDVNSIDMDVQQQLANYHGPYPPGYCFNYLRQGKCVNKNRCLYKHQMPTQVELYRCCVKGIAEAYNKGEAKRAFEIYNSLLETKVALTPCDTLTQLLKVAENNWNVESAFSILDDLNQQNMVTAEVCETLIRLCGPRPEYYWQYLWKLFEIIFKSQRIKLTPDSFTVLLRSFSHLQDLAYLWNVIVYAKKCKVRTVPADLLYNVLAKSLANSDQYYQYLEMWVKLCESNLLQQMNKELRANLIQLFHNRRQIDCEKKLEESVRYANLQQKFDDSNGAPSSTQQQSVVVLKDYIKTTDNYKALHHKIQSCYHTKNWVLLGETFVELCMQGELDNSYYIDPYAKVFLNNIKNPVVLVEAFNMFMLSVSRQYLEEPQEDILAQFDARSLSYIGNRLLYTCQDKKLWLEGHNIVKIMIRYNVPFYRYTEIGKQLSCITAINICLHANDVPTAYSIHLHFGWETQMKMSLPELKFEMVILHDLFDQLLNTKPREALKVLGSCLDIIDNNPELNQHFDFIEDFNKLIVTALDCGDFYVGCLVFKLHSTAQVSQDLDRRILRALLTACGENGYIIEAKELYKICKAKSSYPLQNIQSPRTIHLSTIMTYIEIKLEVESYLEWVYHFLCEFQMKGNLLDNSHFITRVYIERIIDPVAYEMPYLCRVPRTESAAYNMVTKLFLDEFGMEGKIVGENNTLFIYLKMEHIRKYLEILDSKGLRQGFRVRSFNRK